ncbi:hypothetical protein [uncultured Winogradskyella sp.]|uniref:hypothetical protein n=1 Tax=uncultured Winogradskyella sp. TaxID=395353 RepID=UPI0026073684|nr:hypothetical protein [uncultured Winogradskyella sp.]|tara:strand:+ start:879 stop:1349 length:471 start_codon:yes stop_codon:yes gene_type:complete
MGLLEMYFWMVIIICSVLNFPIILFSEDLKDRKRFKKYLKISFSIGLIGIFMLLTNCNYLCGYQYLIFTFSPFITLLVCKIVMILFRKISKIEGFQVTNKLQLFGPALTELSDGIYQKNNGDLKYEHYYNRYTFFITATPVVISFALLILVKENTC